MKAGSRGIKADVAGYGLLKQVMDGLVASSLFNKTTMP